MRSIKIYFVIIFIGLGFFFHGCGNSSYGIGVKLEKSGNYEEALNEYLRALSKKPSNTDIKIAVKRTAERVIRDKIDKGNYYFEKDDSEGAFKYFDVAIGYIKLLKNHNLFLDSSPELMQRYDNVRSKVCDSLYSKGEQAFLSQDYANALVYFQKCWKINNSFKDVYQKIKKAEYQIKLIEAERLYQEGLRLMKNFQYRKAYDQFKSVNRVYGSGFKNADSLLNECQQKGEIKIAIIPSNNSRYTDVTNYIYLRVLDKVTSSGSIFLKIIDREHLNLIMEEQRLGNWYNMNSSNALRLGKNLGIDGIVIIEVSHYAYERKPTLYTAREVCYLTTQQNQFGGLYYIGSRITLNFCIQEETLNIDTSLIVIKIDSGQVLQAVTNRYSDSDYINYIDFNGDKTKLAMNCPEANNLYWPIWALQQAPEKLYMKTETELMENALINAPYNITSSILSTFDR